MRSFIRLLLFCVLLLAGVPVLHASLPKNRVGNFFPLAAESRPEVALQVPELRLDNPCLYGESVSGSTLWTNFDPEGLCSWDDFCDHVGAGLQGAKNVAIGIGKFAKAATYDLGGELGKELFDGYELATSGSTQFNSATAQFFQGQLDADNSTLRILDNAAGHFTPIDSAIETYQHAANGDYDAFSQDMGQLAAMAATPKLLKEASKGGATTTKPAKCGAGGPCFTAGTLVATPDGWKKIEDIREGETVFAFDEKTGKCSEQKVTAILRHKTFWWVDIVVDGETITATRTHRFWVAEVTGWKKAKDLRVGEHLRRLDGSLAKITNLQLWETLETTPTYNLEVENDHTYFVGKAGFLVHNGDTDDRALPVYKDPKDVPKPGTTDMDHRDSQTKFPERKTDPKNQVPEDSYVNRGPRAQKQRALLQWEKWAAENGMSAEDIRTATAGEWKELRDSVDAIPSGRMDEICPLR